MEMRSLFALLFALVIAAPTFAQDRGVGLGGYLQAGNAHESGGLNGKLFLSQRQAVDLQLSIQMSPLAKSMGAYGSYLFHWWDALPINKGSLPLYIGPLAGIGIWNGGFAIRGGGVGGFAYAFPSNTAPLDIYLQLNPVIELHIVDSDNAASFNLFIQFGMRYYL